MSLSKVSHSHGKQLFKLFVFLKMSRINSPSRKNKSLKPSILKSTIVIQTKSSMKKEVFMNFYYTFLSNSKQIYNRSLNLGSGGSYSIPNISVNQTLKRAIAILVFVFDY